MRIQLEVPDTSATQLKTLMKKGNIRTFSDLFNNALTVLYWCLKEREQGRVIASLDEAQNRYKELAMPIFGAVGKDRT